ncbi:hypothetical protein PILCRDRAFT_8009 [Piloderma croceum F 1598]|uniref:Uncharacterized protein n=1 Tax=Piloderma croceum (strain F 1598) TaxID=765440 RepID=A0A0C3FR42_PILCF|nr:hypothetical protein PILCRDRAFT_8009 [Piloderma croceum F 1598]
MSPPSGSTHIGIPPVDHSRQFPYLLPTDPVHQQDFGQPNEHDTSELGIPSSMPDQSRSPRSVTSPRSITESRPPVGRICQYNLPFPSTFPHPLNSPLHPAVNTSTNFFSGGYERLVVTAGVIVTIQIQLLTSDSTAITTTTRTLLAFGVVLELLGILLAICFIQSYHPDEGGRPRQAPSTNNRASSRPRRGDLQGIVEHSNYHERVPQDWSYSLSVGDKWKIVTPDIFLPRIWLTMCIPYQNDVY